MKKPEDMSREEILNTLCAANVNVARSFWDTFANEDLVLQIKSLRRQILNQTIEEFAS